MSHSRAHKRKIYKNLTVSVIFILSFMVMSMGLILSLVQSPKQKSEVYLAQAIHYQEQVETQNLGLQSTAQDYILQQAQDMTLKAIQQNPYHKDAWDRFSQILAQSAALPPALQARDIAASLGLLQPSPTTASLRTMMPARDLALLENTYRNVSQ